jgi:hypothetical protein
MKATPKSCSCRSCKRGKATKTGRWHENLEERAFRRFTKQALRKGEEDIPPAPNGDYKD